MGPYGEETLPPDCVGLGYLVYDRHVYACCNSPAIPMALGTPIHEVPRCRDASMALRWAAAAFVETEKHYRRIMGYEHLWMLKAFLDEAADQKQMVKKRRAG